MSDIQSAAATVSAPIVTSGQAGNQESIPQERAVAEASVTSEPRQETRASTLSPGVGENLDIRA